MPERRPTSATRQAFFSSYHCDPKSLFDLNSVGCLQKNVGVWREKELVLDSSFLSVFLLLFCVFEPLPQRPDLCFFFKKAGFKTHTLAICCQAAVYSRANGLLKRRSRILLIFLFLGAYSLLQTQSKGVLHLLQLGFHSLLLYRASQFQGLWRHCLPALSMLISFPLCGIGTHGEQLGLCRSRTRRFPKTSTDAAR